MERIRITGSTGYAWPPLHVVHSSDFHLPGKSIFLHFTHSSVRSSVFAWLGLSRVIMRCCRLYDLPYQTRFSCLQELDSVRGRSSWTAVFPSQSADVILQSPSTLNLNVEDEHFAYPVLVSPGNNMGSSKGILRFRYGCQSFAWGARSGGKVFVRKFPNHSILGIALRTSGN